MAADSILFGFPYITMNVFTFGSPRPPERPRLRKGLRSGDKSGSDRLGAFGLCRWAVVAVERAFHRVPGPECWLLLRTPTELWAGLNGNYWGRAVPDLLSQG